MPGSSGSLPPSYPLLLPLSSSACIALIGVEGKIAGISTGTRGIPSWSSFFGNALASRWVLRVFMRPTLTLNSNRLQLSTKIVGI